MTTAYIGQALPRVDGPAKVTGGAKYAAENKATDLAHGVVITSPIARGRIAHIDAAPALAVPGVLCVITHENAPRLAHSDDKWNDEGAPPGSPMRWLQDAQIYFSEQPVALVVAETLELARCATTLVHIDYQQEPHETDFDAQRGQEFEAEAREGIQELPPPRGDPAGAFERAAIRHEAEYHLPAEHHNPMEMFGTTVARAEDGTLTVYDKTQGAPNVHSYLCNVFGIGEDELRVLSPYVGGAFGLGLRPQYTTVLAVMAARMLERSVRVALTRQQMFGLGFRPMTWQRVALGADQDGRLQSLSHHVISATSRHEQYTEPVLQFTGLYKCDNVEFKHNILALDLNTPSDMRGPGASWGMFALECAMDELAVAAGIDPLELRLRNYADVDQIECKPYSSNSLRECYRQAAERFGWSKRDPRPRSMRNGHQLIGWGMASGKWEAMQQPATAKAVLQADGTLTVCSATADIGTGTYTIMTQIAAEELGVPIDRVTFELGDSSLPRAPVEGGSFTAATVGTAVKAVCDKMRRRLFTEAQRIPGSPFAGVQFSDVTFADGSITARGDPGRSYSLTDLFRILGLKTIEDEATTEPSPELEKYSRYTHTAVFAEVNVDADFGTTKVTRIVSAIAGGRILNPKTAHSQIMGGIVWGIGMALEEESVVDHNFGRFMTRNLADYHFPVNADIHDIDVIFVEEKDEIINPLGVKGLGEPGLVGVAPAIANAVYHATGKRIRSLPITPDKLL